MKITKSILIVIILLFGPDVYSQVNVIDTSKSSPILKNTKKPGGIFIAPVLGAEFPTKDFVANSKYAFCIGGRLEYSSMNIYPFVIGASIQYQNHDGADDYKTTNLLNSMSTKITSFGISLDMILNKYLKSTFTIPFIFVEARSVNVKREVSPSENIHDLKSTDNTIGFGGGFGFTLYIFDIYTTYFSAKEYSTISIKTRFRFPLLKF
jgi:hypothetical protein